MKNRLSVIGVAVLAPLLLSACTSGSAERPESTPTPTYLKVGSAFDAPKQVELPRGSDDGVFLPKGTAFFSQIVEEKPTETATPDPLTPAPRDTPPAPPRPAAKYEFKYKQYDGQGDGWTTPLSETSAPDVATANYLTSWQGKDYLVAVQTYTKDTDSPSSISKGVVTQVATADVLDPETGKIVKSIRYENKGEIKVLPSTEGIIVMTIADDGSRRIILLNPTNGNVADEEADFDPESIIGAVNGKFLRGEESGSDISISIPNGEGIKGITTYKKFVVGGKLTPKGEVSPTTVLLDGTTGKQVAALECGPVIQRGSIPPLLSGEPSVIQSSPDGRYIVVSKSMVFDTQDGKGFCGLESEKQKKLTLGPVDNDGNAYGKTSDGYFKINVASGEATPQDAENDSAERPAFISEDGWGIFPQIGSAEKAFAIPPQG